MSNPDNSEQNSVTVSYTVSSSNSNNQDQYTRVLKEVIKYICKGLWPKNIYLINLKLNMK